MPEDPVGAAARDERQPEPSDDSLAERARFWFLEAWNHPFWREYRDESKEDQGFYRGGKAQWSQDYSTEDFEKLKAAKRAVVTINHCQSPVEVLVGYQRRNRYDIAAAPQGGEDLEDTQLLSHLLKWQQEQSEVPEYRSECFEGGVITGLSALACEIDWSSDTFQGEIQVSVVAPGRELLWDPASRRYDLSDARYALRYKWVFVQDLLAEFPGDAEVIRAAVASLDAALAAGERRTTEPAGDAYGDVRGHPIENLGPVGHFYNPQEQTILVLEAWYRDYEWKWIVVDRAGGKPQDEDSQGEPLTAKAALAIAETEPEVLKAIRRRLRRIRMATILPATYQVLEDGPTPYDNDADAFPFVPFWVYRQGDHVWGVIRNLKDPQRVENKRWSQMLDILAKFANIRIVYAEGSVVDPRVLEEPFSTAPIPWRREPGENTPAPGFLVPPVGELTRVLVEIANQMAAKLREVPGINTELLGIQGDASSGVAIARRQAQGELISTRLFDNERRTGKLLGQRLARRIAQRYTTEEVVRLTDAATGEAFDVVVNPAAARVRDAQGRLKPMGLEQWRTFRERQKEAGRPRVLRDISALKYDVIISEVPATPSARAGKALALVELAEKFPQLFPVLAEDIFELLDVPNRSRILAKIRALTSGTPPQPGGGTPANGGGDAAAEAMLRAMTQEGNGPPPPAAA